MKKSQIKLNSRKAVLLGAAFFAAILGYLSDKGTFIPLKSYKLIEAYFGGVMLNSLFAITGPTMVFLAISSGLFFLQYSLFSWLPRKGFKLLLIFTAALSVFIWLIPFDAGFQDFFRNW
jgi:hypothetical protein